MKKINYIFLIVFGIILFSITIFLNPISFITLFLILLFLCVFYIITIEIDVKNMYTPLGFLLILIINFFIYTLSIKIINNKFINLKPVTEVKLTIKGFVIKYQNKDKFYYKTFSSIPKCNKLFIADKVITYSIFNNLNTEIIKNQLICKKKNKGVKL